jgi:uncharacterized protein YbaP (TraB family)
MRKTCLIFCIVPFLFSFNLVSAQSQPASLLWRITGNGLEKPSYLYGTMHLKDRRLFFFSDSLYKSIENAAGFAMEIDPNEMMDSLFSSMSTGDTSALLREILDKKQYDKVAKKLEKKLGIPAERITKKKIVEIRESWYYKVRKNDDMKTAMDLYLFDIAKKQGKLVGGIEDVSDQLNFRDELGKDIDISEYINDDDEAIKKAYLEKMIDVYVKQDINQLEKMVNASGSARDFAMIKRNIKMARRMDSLAHIRNSFFAVGAAHLPGDSGVVKLLQQRGFTVEPVVSPKKITPESYTYKAIDIPWIKMVSEDSAYEIDMPGKPSEVKLLGDEFKMKMYADMVTNVVYMTGFSFVSDENPENIMNRMIRSFTSKGFDKLEDKKIAHNGMDGKELIAIRENIYYRLQLFLNSRKLYMVMVGGEKKEDVYSKGSEKFFQSFVANTKLEPKTKTWVNYINDQKAFSLSFPQKPAIVKAKENESNKSFETYSYSAVDILNNSYYLIAVSDTRKGYLITDDSLIFNTKLEYYRQNKMAVNDIRKFEFSGYPAMSFSASVHQDGVDYISKLLIVSRGNRSYTLAAVTEKSKEDYPEITRFFRSFILQPYKLSDWSVKEADKKLFSTWAPSAITRIPPDTAGLTGEELHLKSEESKKEIEFNTFEPAAPVNYNINIKIPSKYYWIKDDSLFLSEQLKTYYTDTASYEARNNPGNFDSLIYKKSIWNGKSKGYEILVKNGSKSYYKKVRVIRNADSSYHLFVMAPYTFINNENNNRFFEDFRFEKEEPSSSLFTNKTNIILQDLLSSDSSTRADAFDALSKTKFTAEDLPLLHKAFLLKYPEDTINYNSVTNELAEKISKINDSSSYAFIKNNYSSVTDRKIKNSMLYVLATQQTQQSTLLLKEFFLNKPPDADNINSIIYEVDDSLLLAKQLFPEAASLFTDTLYGPGFIYLAEKLADSNLIDKTFLDGQKDAILKNAAWQSSKLKRDKDDYLPFANDMIKVLAKINNKESVTLLNGFVSTADLYIKQNAILALAGINKPVPAVELRKVAASPGYRTDFYESLKKLKKENLFPKELLSQQKFAESYLYNNINEEGDIEESDISFKLMAEKSAIIKGIVSRYYFYKVMVKYDGEITIYPAVCGAFDTNKLIPLIKNDEYNVEIFYDEKFSAATVNKLFDRYIKSLREK